MSGEKYVVGLDYGTDSVRALLVDSKDGKEIGSEVFYYPRWKEEMYCDPLINRYRQHPDDYLEGIEYTIRALLQHHDIIGEDIKSICIDTTGSSPIAVDMNGVPLCYNPAFAENPNAMTILWKDHTAVKEAEEINKLARSWGGVDFTKYEGGIYSSEWFWAKILHTIRNDGKVRVAAYSWMEHCDLMTYMLVGSSDLTTFKRSRCAAGHKAMWHESWDGLPDDEFLSLLDPKLVDFKKHLYDTTYTADTPAGTLSPEWASKLGLSEETIVAVGTFDAHAGAIGAEAKEHTLVRVMGTSTCDIIIASPEAIGGNTVKGICGQVDGSVLPGMIGLEAGQSAFGDLLAWFRDVLSWPLDNLLSENVSISAQAIDKMKDQMITALSKQASELPMSEAAPIALDWINGRRTPDANQALKSAIINLNLGTKAPEIFRALVEAICFGSKSIVERFQEEGVEINEVIGIGGVAKKSPFIMQTLADVLNMPIRIIKSEQAPALGAAMYAATAAGIYPTVQEAIKAMGNGFEETYTPNADLSEIYNRRYTQYKLLGKFVEKSSITIFENET
ncbi:MAG: L-ribulokinase [Saprospiraceae bacterium]|jgi:L-ribulokinase